MTSLPIIDLPESRPLPQGNSNEPGQSKGTYAFVLAWVFAPFKNSF